MGPWHQTMSQQDSMWKWSVCPSIGATYERSGDSFNQRQIVSVDAKAVYTNLVDDHIVSELPPGCFPSSSSKWFNRYRLSWPTCSLPLRPDPLQSVQGSYGSGPIHIEASSFHQVQMFAAGFLSEGVATTATLIHINDV
jgi:hypothetical protein